MSSVRRDEFGEPVISTPGLMIHVSDMTVSHSLGWHLNRRIFSNLAATYRGRVPFFSEEPIVFSQVYFREPTNIAWGMSTDDAANKVGMIHLGPIRLRFWDQDGLDCWQSLWRIFDHTPGHWHGNPCNCHQDLWTNH
ncbi:hypothetical protein [Crossiella sp. S99.1]|nr:hypothetical protein [Crossiella sp. S99.1]MCK2255009.1 hypothetical protein [Crossiella sp. S99.1]